MIVCGMLLRITALYQVLIFMNLTEEDVDIVYILVLFTDILDIYNKTCVCFIIVHMHETAHCNCACNNSTISQRLLSL